MVKEKTCYQNLNKPRCIDLVLTNKNRMFQNTTTIDIGLSDFHKMVLTSFKSTYDPGKPKELTYRDYKKFNNIEFREELKTATDSCNTWGAFETRYLNILNKHAPLKKKTIRANHAPYMTKALRKAIMKRTQLANKYHKTKLELDYRIFRKHKNYVDRLYKREKKHFYQNLSINDLKDNKQFWKTMKPLLSDKSKGEHRIMLVKGDQIIANDKDIAENFSKYFINAVQNLHIPEVEVDPVEHLTDKIDIAIEKYKNHPSILKIKEKVTSECDFEFYNINENEVILQFKTLNTNKSTTFENIPGKILKENAYIYYKTVTKIINDNLDNNTFPDDLKFADVYPVFKNGNRNDVEAFRPVSVLTYGSKIFERIIQKQLLEKMDPLLSKYLCGYRKGYNAQHALISMLEKWRKSLDTNGFAGAVLMDLSKAFDCMNHELLLAKLSAYGFKKSALELIHNYLKNRWQRVKINNKFSPWEELLLGVPQGSVLGPILFNIYLNDLMWFITEGDVCNFADDTTLSVCDKDLHLVLKSLEKDSSHAINWFKLNYMKLNPDKCKLIVAGRKDHQVSIKVGESDVKENSWVKLLGVHIDNKLTFRMYLIKKLKQANSKLAVIKRNKGFISSCQIKILLSSFVHSQLAYAPLVWMFHNKDLHNKINRVHERALRILYEDDISSFSELLQKDGSFTVHERNIQTLLMEMFKAKHNLEPALLKYIFTEHKYSGPVLRKDKHFLRPKVRTLRYGERSLQNFGAIIWNQPYALSALCMTFMIFMICTLGYVLWGSQCKTRY